MPRPMRRSSAARTGQRRPADLVPVGLRDRPVDARPAGAARSASSPSGAAAPNQTVSQPCARAISAARRATAGVGSSTPVSSRITSNGCSASNSAAPRQVERVDDQRAGRLAHRQVVHELLDAAGPGREVVGDQQGPAHALAPAPYARAAGDPLPRWTDGCANSRYSSGCGSGSARLSCGQPAPASPRTCAGSSVSASACASARASIAAGHQVCSRAGDQPGDRGDARAAARSPAARRSSVDAGPRAAGRSTSRAGRARSPRRRRRARRAGCR